MEDKAGQEPPVRDWRQHDESLDRLIPEEGGPAYSDDDIRRGELQFQLLFRIVMGLFLGGFASLAAFYLLAPAHPVLFVLVMGVPFFSIALPVFFFGEPLVRWIFDALGDLLR